MKVFAELMLCKTSLMRYLDPLLLHQKEAIEHLKGLLPSCRLLNKSPRTWISRHSLKLMSCSLQDGIDEPAKVAARDSGEADAVLNINVSISIRGSSGAHLLQHADVNVNVIKEVIRHPVLKPLSQTQLSSKIVLLSHVTHQ